MHDPNLMVCLVVKVCNMCKALHLDGHKDLKNRTGKLRSARHASRCCLTVKDYCPEWLYSFNLDYLLVREVGCK